MANLDQGRNVKLKPEASDALAYPPAGKFLRVAVHAGALRAPENKLTLAIEDDGGLTWIGAIDERMVEPGMSANRKHRDLIKPHFFKGDALWHLAYPGLLTRSGVPTPYHTVYDGRQRPWIIVGELPNGSLMAMPLNERAARLKPYTPPIDAAHIPQGTSKDAQLELAHLWTFPATIDVQKRLADPAIPSLEAAIRAYY